MYVRPNFKTKKALREAVTRGDRVTVWQPGPFEAITDGTDAVEGPWGVGGHTWYATVDVVGGVVTRVR
jgi:hypothetical protein